MQLSNAEKLMLVMLSEIHEKLGIEEGVDSHFVKEAIYTDNTWALSWEMQGIIQGNKEPDPPQVKYVVDVLDMWYFLEEGFKNLSKIDKEELKESAKPFGDHVLFHGFDGNNESELLSIADFFINEMKRFQTFVKRDLNSHHPTNDIYHRMLKVFLPIKETLNRRSLSVKEIADILNSMKYIE